MICGTGVKDPSTTISLFGHSKIGEHLMFFDVDVATHAGCL
jgi:hypothetical protein